MKKFMHKIAIEFPIVTIALIVGLGVILTLMLNNCKVYKYIETQADVDVTNQCECSVSLNQDYYEGIKSCNKIVWYFNLESAVYDGEIKSIKKEAGKCNLIIKLGEGTGKRIKFRKKVYLKISYKRESIMEHLISK